MNWYKKNQRTELEYEDIGHADYEQPEYEEKLNKIWIYYKGELLVGEETDLTPTHQDVFPFIYNQEQYYRGRYNPKTEQLSLMVPFRSRFSGIPEEIIYLLSRKFNDPIIKVFSEKKNWYKTIKLATPRTLYHGTSIDNYSSIKELGLVPDVGNFVTDAYAGEYEAAGMEFDPTPLTYATDKDDLGKAVTAMTNAVANMLGKGYHGVTENELKNYGLLAIIKHGEENFERRPIEEEGPWRDWQGETDNQYPAVEPGDYYSEYSQGPVEILIGNKMVDFLKKHGEWRFRSLENMKAELLTMAIRYHIKQHPDLKEQIVQTIRDKVSRMDEKEIYENHKIYTEAINELV